MEQTEARDIINDVAQLPYSLHRNTRKEFSFVHYDIKGNKTGVKKIVFYDGETEGEEVTFVCFKEHTEAAKVCKLSRRVTHPRVLRASFSTFNTTLKEHLVCFDRFHGFLPQSPNGFLDSLKRPRVRSKTEISNNPDADPDNPNKVVQNEIESLTDAIIYLHSKKYSTSWLDMDGGYVWSEGKLKIFMVDCCEDGCTDKEWTSITTDNVLRFGMGLLEYFLDPSDKNWNRRDSFLACFRVPIKYEDKRLLMIKNHPFLKVNVKTVFQFVSEVQHGLVSKKHGELDLSYLEFALKEGHLDKYFIVGGTKRTGGKWSGQMSWTFNNIKKKVVYDDGRMEDLLRFIRNIYQHHSSGSGLTTNFNEIQRNWPFLIDYIHEYVYGRVLPKPK